MSAHCSLEILSTYVDAELPDGERRHVESHITSCADCRRRLAHLQGVVGHLQRLEQVEVPPTLVWQVQHRVRLESGKVTLSSRLEDRLGKLLRQPLLAPLFAVIVAFAAILYLFSIGVARQTAIGTRVVVGGATQSAASETEGIDAAGAARETATDSGAGGEGAQPRLEVMAERASDQSAAAQSSRVTTERLVAAGREFRLVGGVWKELGLGEASSDKQIDLAAGGVLPEELKELARRSGTYWLVIDGQVVEVVIPENGAGMP